MIPTITHPAAFLLFCAVASSPGTAATMTADYLACRSEAAFDRAEALRRSADREAAATFVAKTILDGECIWLRAGTPVQIAGSAASPLYLVVVPLGETVTFVTYRRFVQ